MHDLSLTLWRKCLRISIAINAIHVPLDVSNVRRRENAAHFLYDILLHEGIAQIENALISALTVWLSRNLQHPLGMRTVKITVHVDHLRLHPDAKVQAERVHLLSKPLYASGELFLILRPVAERASVIIPLAKPAVVHDEQLDADALCGLREPYELRLVEIKIISLPAV